MISKKLTSIYTLSFILLILASCTAPHSANSEKNTQVKEPEEKPVETEKQKEEKTNAFLFVKAKYGLPAFDNPEGNIIDSIPYNSQVEVVQPYGNKFKFEYMGSTYHDTWVGVKYNEKTYYVCKALLGRYQDISNHQEAEEIQPALDSLSNASLFKLKNDTTIISSEKLTDSYTVSSIDFREYLKLKEVQVKTVIDSSAFTKTDSALYIYFRTDTLKIRDHFGEEDSWDEKHHSYSGYYPHWNKHVVQVSEYEWGSYLLVDGKDAKVIRRFNGKPLYNKANRNITTIYVEHHIGQSYISIFEFENKKWTSKVQIHIGLNCNEDMSFVDEAGNIYLVTHEMWNDDDFGPAEAYKIFKLAPNTEKQ